MMTNLCGWDHDGEFYSRERDSKKQNVFGWKKNKSEGATMTIYNSICATHSCAGGGDNVDGGFGCWGCITPLMCRIWPGTVRTAWADRYGSADVATATADEASVLPSYWDEVKDPSSTVEYFPLEPGTEEPGRVYDAISLSTGPLELTIHSIERVQNIGLWQAYCAKKSEIVQREASRRPPNVTNHSGTLERNWVFHGLESETADKVAQLGFNRAFCGENAVFYGKGVYFARDASYSAYPLYSPPDAGGVQTMFAVRLAVGNWSQGVRGAPTPAVRDPARGLLYDTTVDRMDDPSIFVAYHSAQCYPEYRVRFTQANPARSHPKAGKPSPKWGKGYRPDMLAP